RAAREGAWDAVLTAWLWSGCVTCAIALVALLARWPVSAYAFAHGRAVGIFQNPNELALFALSVLGPAAGALLYNYRGRRLAIVTLVLAVAALFATGSRSGEASFGIGAVALLLALRRSPTRANVLALVVVAAIGIAFAFGFDSRHNPAESDTRVVAWQAGLRTIALFPLTGVGVGAYYRLYPFVRPPDAPSPPDPVAFDPHDFYLSVAAETGLLGLAAFVWTIVLFAREAGAILKSAPETSRRFGLAVLAGLLAIACHLIFNGFAISIVLWSILAALTMGIPRSEHRHAA
ncbi:MAG: O-antigen ligase family protein, partial [Candidatus Eremiobacteraeota bacterium]|nr:O-antigen ligase family protein [Candidatus Eremiobacteraeota bacterium]